MFALAGVAVLLIGLASSSKASPASTLSTAATSGATTRLAWFYGEPQDGTSATTLAASAQQMVLSGHQVEDGYLQQLRTAGYSAAVPGYIELPRTMGIPASQCASNPTFAGYTTSWTSWDGEFCTYLNPHEDWFLHNASGQRIYSSGGWYYMNPANAGWQAYMVGKVGRYVTEFSGISDLFLDDTWATAVTARNAGCVEAICQNDSAWHAATLADLQAIKAAIGSRKLWINSDDVSAAGYGGAVDGFMIENFATGWNAGQWMSQSEIQARLADIDAKLAAGGSALLVGQGAQSDTQEMRFSHALYLMVAGPNVSYRFGEDYTQLWTCPSTAGTSARPVAPASWSTRPPTSATSPTARHLPT